MIGIIKLSLIFVLFLFAGCTPASKDSPPPTIDVPRISSLAGSTIRIKTTDVYEIVESPIIFTDSGQLIPDGTKFNLVATGVTISTTTNSAWQSSLIVSSVSGKFSFYVKPFTVAGLYRVNAYPIENSTIEFDQGLNARFFIDVAPGNPSSMGIVKTDQFEDKVPYNNAKDSLENWILTSNPDLISYISVGPVQDLYNNLLNEGTIGLSVNSGEILSENPARIISGYAYFAYKSDGLINNLNTQASLFHSSNVSLSLNSVIKKASPQLVYSANADFSNMTIGSTRCQVISLTNSGAMPATNLDLSSSFPFNLVAEDNDDVLCPLTGDICHQRQSLRSGESCKVRLKFQMPNSGSVSGDLIAQMSPNEFSGALAVQRLRTDAVSAAQLATVNSFISFGGTQCATTRTLDIVVENIGDFDATNISVVNPPPNLNQSSPFYSLILPPQDAILNPNLSTVVNCGTTFPAHRRCRVQVRFNPNAGIANQALIGRLIGDNINPLILTVSGYTIPGQGLNTFPITLLTPNNSILPLGMNLSSSQQTRVDIGPVVDACNQKVADGSILTASVTAGSLSNTTFVTNNGSATIYWNSSSNPLHLGTQTLNVNVGTGGSKTADLFFRGINLSLSGNSNFGQVIESKPKQIELTLTNSGNIDANNLSFSTGSPLVITDQGTCSSGTLSVGQSCILTITADPQGINDDLTINVNVNSATAGINSVSYPLSLNARTKPVLSFDHDVYLFNDGSSSSNFERTVTLTNNGPAISYDTQVLVDSPFTIQSSTCTSTMNVNQSCQLVLRLALTDVNNAVGKIISVSNEIDTNSPIANLGFSRFSTNQNSFLSLQGRCVGPINFSVVGSSGSSITVSNSVVASLVSNLGGVFYSSSSCNSGTEITQSSIGAGNSQSSNFYYKTENIGTDVIEITNPIISSGISSIQVNQELTLNVPSPNALISNEELILIASGGYGSYIYNFSDGSSTSAIANIVNILAPDSDDVIGRRLVVLSQTVAGSKIVRITDAQGFYKDFTFNLYPPLTVVTPVAVRSSSPVSLSFNDYGNPNTKTFTLQHFSSPNYINGSLYGSTVNSSGVYSSGASIPITTEYVLIEISKATGGSTSARITINVNIEWPYGTLGDLIINSGQTITLNSAQSYDYNTIWVKSGGTLYITQVSGKESEPVYLGSVNDFRIDGTISFKTYYNEDSSVRSYTSPDNKTIYYQNVLSRGGYGGSPQCGFTTGGGGGAPFGSGGSSTLSNGYTTGPHGSSAGAFYGGATYPVYAPNNCTPNYRTYSCSENIFGFCSEPDGTYKSTYVGGVGGNAGMNGGNLYLKSHGQILGSGGVINLNGNNGADGGGASWSICNPNAGVTPNSTGRGGGGGGGGNGGKLFYRSTNVISGISIFTSAGGGGQPGASPYNASCTIGGGYYPTAGGSGYSGYIQKIP